MFEICKNKHESDAAEDGSRLHRRVLMTDELINKNTKITTMTAAAAIFIIID